MLIEVLDRIEEIAVEGHVVGSGHLNGGEQTLHRAAVCQSPPKGRRHPVGVVGAQEIAVALCLIDHIVQPDLASRIVERHHRGSRSTAPSTTDHHRRHGRRQANAVQGSKRGDHTS
jgi:hypothetical protein